MTVGGLERVDKKDNDDEDREENEDKEDGAIDTLQMKKEIEERMKQLEERRKQLENRKDTTYRYRSNALAEDQEENEAPVAKVTPKINTDFPIRPMTAVMRFIE